MSKYGLFYVMWRDEYGSFSSELFILEMSEPCKASEKAIKEVIKYLPKNGELFKIKYFCPITFDNIVAMMNSADVERPSIVNHFLEMYFTL